MQFHRSLWVFPFIAGVVASPTPSLAHVKWFEPCEISIKPVPTGEALSQPAFWIATALVLALFLATVMAERTSLGRSVTTRLDRLTAPLRARADQFIVCIVGGFFVALFATGTTILTPELLTDARWVGWLQLPIAMCLFSRRLYPFAASRHHRALALRPGRLRSVPHAGLRDARLPGCAQQPRMLREPICPVRVLNAGGTNGAVLRQ